MGYRILALGAFLAVQTLTGATADIAHARALYNRTDFPGAVAVLKPLAADSAAAAQLLGESYYMQAEFKRATEAFEKALALDPDRASSYLWLGRVYGRRAEVGSPLTAPLYASKARNCFEKAVQLDPSNGEATGDLFEYYLQAPGFLGGGYDKAAALAVKIGVRDAAEGAFAKARLAEQRKDFPAAEAELRRAAELAPKQTGRVLDLAKFLAKHQRFEESDALFQSAHLADPQSPKILFSEASTYIRFRRKPDAARELLEHYLKLRLSPEDPTPAEARKLLRQLARQNSEPAE